MGYVLGKKIVFVDNVDVDCHFEVMLKDAILHDYDPMSGEISPTCLSCSKTSCTYHPDLHVSYTAAVDSVNATG